MPPTYYYYLHILIPFFTSYTFYNASRRSFADTSLKLLSDNTITEAQYARVNSITSTLYGVSEYVASIVLNYVSPKTTYLFGLLMSSIVVTAAGLFLKNGSIMAYLITWVVTTLFYGFCWPSIAFMVRLWVPSYGILLFSSVLFTSARHHLVFYEYHNQFRCHSGQFLYENAEGSTTLQEIYFDWYQHIAVRPLLHLYLAIKEHFCIWMERVVYGIEHEYRWWWERSFITIVCNDINLM